ncbi:hypothetical protein GQ651_11880 [Alphaproteobacteria bacterium GH1-50]|uniref:Uncharacterized protein n=1 Tax=Kangsaoukella pontilimi TaxID=2691042 RepID=A0A7C9ISD0_9RHOB|nr:hypothetical protein [Kangsaoukella pontilimi]MXQ08546.1 hypothetical protein [Kangsaoukella pontilimi]
MHRALTLIALLAVTACGGLAWNTTVANDPNVRWAMVTSVQPGFTTETDHVARWGNPTQKIRQGAETRFVYRDMTNPEGYGPPQFGRSDAYVVVVFHYGTAVGAYSSDTEGCRATFSPRPPGYGFDNPTTVHPVNCILAGPATGSRSDPTGTDTQRQGPLSPASSPVRKYPRRRQRAAGTAAQISRARVSALSSVRPVRRP